jgi:hypothetical protein
MPHHGEEGLIMTARLKWSRDNMRPETGPERAQRRAWARGLAVGAPVRAFIGQGRPRPNGNGHPGRPTPQGVLVPLERVDRLARYLLQRDVTTHVRHGIKWKPSARQRRRLDQKAHQSSHRRLLESQRLDNPAGYVLAMSDTRGPAASAAIVDEPPRVGAWNEPARLGVTPPVMMENPPQRGFRVTDRRGEHRS